MLLRDYFTLTFDIYVDASRCIFRYNLQYLSVAASMSTLIPCHLNCAGCSWMGGVLVITTRGVSLYAIVLHSNSIKCVMQGNGR